MQDPEVKAVLGKPEDVLDKAFDLNRYTRHIDTLFKRAGIEG